MTVKRLTLRIIGLHRSRWDKQSIISVLSYSWSNWCSSITPRRNVQVLQTKGTVRVSISSSGTDLMRKNLWISSVTTSFAGRRAQNNWSVMMRKTPNIITNTLSSWKLRQFAETTSLSYQSPLPSFTEESTLWSWSIKSLSLYTLLTARPCRHLKLTKWTSGKTVSEHA